MSQEQFDLTWHTYTDHLRSMLHDLMYTNELTDVTLVSEDKKQFKVHKVILSASSSFFRNIICDLSSPLIYLRGIQSYQIESILQFIYLGKTTIFKDQMINFLDVAKSLEIDEVVRLFDTDFDNLKDVQGLDQTDDSDQSVEKVRSSVIKENPMKIYKIGDKFHCKKCDMKFKRKSTARKHIRSVHLGHKYSCEQCNSKFSLRSSLNVHTKALHEGVIYSCNKCSYKARNQSQLYKHVKSVHEGVTYPCDHCNYAASRKDHLKTHMKLMHNEQKFMIQQDQMINSAEDKELDLGLQIADLDNENFDVVEILSIQENDVDVDDFEHSGEKIINSVIKENPMKVFKSGSDFACNKCNMKSKKKSYVKRHIRAVHLGYKYSCDQCDSKFSFRPGLNEHVKSMHEGVKYKCDNCSHVSKYRSDLHMHVKSVHEGVTYPCDQCDYAPSRKYHLKTHMKSMHNEIKAILSQDQMNTPTKTAENKELDEDEKDQNDENIGEVETQGIQQIDHSESCEVKKENIQVLEQRNTNSEINYETQFGIFHRCNECDLQYKFKHHLNRHIKSVHHGIKFSCNQCESVLSSQSNLNLHKRSVHEGVKYSCDNCSYKASTPSQVHKHAKAVHEGVKYPCDQCSYKASRKDSLKTHMKWTHKGHAYLCDQCSHKATTSNDLLLHQRQKHGINSSIKNENLK